MDNKNEELYEKLVNSEKRIEDIAKKICYILAIFGVLALLAVISSIWVNGFPRMPDHNVHIVEKNY